MMRALTEPTATPDWVGANIDDIVLLLPEQMLHHDGHAASRVSCTGAVVTSRFPPDRCFNQRLGSCVDAPVDGTRDLASPWAATIPCSTRWPRSALTAGFAPHRVRKDRACCSSVFSATKRIFGLEAASGDRLSVRRVVLLATHNGVVSQITFRNRKCHNMRQRPTAHCVDSLKFKG